MIHVRIIVAKFPILADLPLLRTQARLGEFPVVYRVWRSQQGGGFGDQARHPYAWGVLVYVDGALCRIISARGSPREWSNLERLERWLRAQGFRYWWMRNDLEPLGEEDAGQEEPSAAPKGPWGPVAASLVALTPLFLSSACKQETSQNQESCSENQCSFHNKINMNKI